MALEAAEKLIARLGGPDATADIMADLIRQDLAQGNVEAAGRLIMAILDAASAARQVSEEGKVQRPARIM